MDEKELPDHEITRKIIGCAMAIHSELRSGFQEVIYQRAMEIEMNKLCLEFHREFEMPIHYKKILSEPKESISLSAEEFLLN